MEGKGFCVPTVMINLVNLMLVSKYLTNLKRKCSFIVNLWPFVIYKFFLMPSGNGDVSYSLVTYESQARLTVIFFLFITSKSKSQTGYWLSKVTLTYIWETQDHYFIYYFFQEVFFSRVYLTVQCVYVVTLWQGEAHYDSEQCHVWRLYFAIRHFYLNLRPS